MSNKNKTVSDRNQYVVKANSIIRTRYNLTLAQQKLVLFCISKIKPDDMIDTEYTFSIDEVCSACGIKLDGGGYYYKSIKDDLIKLTQREWGVWPTGEIKTISWLGDVDIQPNSGTVKVTFNKNMKPFLYDLQRNYTQYQLKNALVFRCKHSLRLYEILRSYTTQKKLNNYIESEVMFKIPELRELLDCQNYAKWAEFDRCVIRKAVTEINELCDDIHVDYDIYKNGKTVESINFIITTPNSVNKAMAIIRKQKRLK